MYNMTSSQSSVAFTSIFFNSIVNYLTNKTVNVYAGVSQILLIYDKFLGALFASF